MTDFTCNIDGNSHTETIRTTWTPEKTQVKKGDHITFKGTAGIGIDFKSGSPFGKQWQGPKKLPVGPLTVQDDNKGYDFECGEFRKGVTGKGETFKKWPVGERTPYPQTP